jgi:hypothetical protein
MPPLIATPSAPEAPPEVVVVAPPEPGLVVRPVLRLDRASTSPGARVSVTGAGCDPGAPVTVDIADRRVGSGEANGLGSFSLPVDVPSLVVGRYDVTATCGPVLATTLDVVLVSHVDPGTNTLALLVFFVLIALALIRRQRTGRT